MKIAYLAALFAFLGSLPMAYGQGTVIYDQQSSVDGAYLEGANGDVRTLTMGQSFTPTLDSVGFVRLFINNAYPSDTTNGVFYVILRSGSISGPILGTSGLA